MRRLLFFLACVTVGVGLLILLSAGTGAGTWFGITFCAFLVVCGVIGGRWGRGSVAGGVRAPQLARMGMSVVALCGLSAIVLLWRPSVGAGLPMVPFLLCITIGGLLMVPVGLMGDEASKPQG